MSDPVAQLFPPEEPEPQDGCGVCAALDRQRTEARNTGDLSRVIDLNIELRNHQAKRAGQER